MAIDVYTKLVLTVMAGALLIIAWQGTRVAAAGRSIAYVLDQGYGASGRSDTFPASCRSSNDDSG